ncbi:hypothetical protein E2C01_057122 [Portunus trituberculatus]|uniref:Uncharacterized protein n=1 Tax=Portunus trituberculatus TaxID=210409 RepID=A0A5B7GS59_PORTR|nr:hypothetical protein [Portunus trituberculatus]
MACNSRGCGLAFPVYGVCVVVSVPREDWSMSSE